MECSQIAIGALHFVAAQNFTATQRNSQLRCSSRTTPKSRCASDLFLTRQTTHSLQIQHTACGTHLPRHRCHSRQADDQHTTPEPSTSSRPLPSVSRQQIFQNCYAVSAALAAAGAGIRAVAPIVSAGLFKTDAAAVQALLQSEYTSNRTRSVSKAIPFAIDARSNDMCAIAFSWLRRLYTSFTSHTCNSQHSHRSSPGPLSNMVRFCRGFRHVKSTGTRH